jgi:hypothetical protein
MNWHLRLTHLLWHGAASPCVRHAARWQVLQPNQIEAKRSSVSQCEDRFAQTESAEYVPMPRGTAATGWKHRATNTT